MVTNESLSDEAECCLEAPENIICTFLRTTPRTDLTSDSGDGSDIRGYGFSWIDMTVPWFVSNCGHDCARLSSPSSQRINQDHNLFPLGRSLPFDISTFGITYSELYPTQVSGFGQHSQVTMRLGVYTAGSVIHRAKVPNLVCDVGKRKASE
jgi:hypothetical protein